MCHNIIHISIRLVCHNIIRIIITERIFTYTNIEIHTHTCWCTCVFMLSCALVVFVCLSMLIFMCANTAFLFMVDTDADFVSAWKWTCWRQCLMRKVEGQRRQRWRVHDNVDPPQVLVRTMMMKVDPRTNQKKMEWSTKKWENERTNELVPPSLGCLNAWISSTL